MRRFRKNSGEKIASSWEHTTPFFQAKVYGSKLSIILIPKYEFLSRLTLE